MRTFLFALAVFFFCAYQTKAQLSRSSLAAAKGVSTIKGDYYFDHKNYVIAINHYSKSIRQNAKDAYSMLRMAESYHKIQKDDLASQWYNKAFAINANVEEAYLLKYISLLNTLGKYDELKRWIAIYNERIAKNYLDGGHALYNNSAMFILHHPVSLNSDKSDTGPALYNGKLIFSSDRAATGSGSYKLYNSVLDPKSGFGDVMPFYETISAGANNGAIAIATETSTLFFTNQNQPSADGEAFMEISYCDVPSNASEVLKINKLTFKNFNHSIGHPAVNSKGTVLFFAASSPRHTRGFDLYKSEYNGKKWSFPVALGPAVNTHGDEMYPTLYNDSILYFASNVQGGLGGFDIYKVNIQDKSPRVEHLNAPVNSPFNDFGLVINNTGSEGYLSSNRPGGLGGDDLYKFYILPIKKVKHTTHENHEELFIYTSKGDEIKLSERTKGNLKFDFTPGRRYNLTVEYDNFKTGAINTSNNATALPKLNIYTFDIQNSAETHAQKNKIAPIQNIHINPGDLVTFQLIPNLTTDSWADNGKIQFHSAETIIGDRESIVFSYVAAGGPKISEIEDTSPIANLSALDTASSTEPLIAKETQNKPSKILTTDESKSLATTTQYKPANTATSADMVTGKDHASNSDPLAVSTSLDNTQPITDERSIAKNREANLTSTTQLTEITPKSKINVSPDSLKEKTVVSNTNETKDPTQLLSTNEAAIQDQGVSAEVKNVNSNVVNGNSAKTELQNRAAEKTALTPDTNRFDSLNNETLFSKNNKQDPAQLSADATTLLNQSVSNKGKSIDSATTVTTSVETANQNLLTETNLASADTSTSDSLNSNNTILKNQQRNDVSQLSPVHSNGETSQGGNQKNIDQNAKAIHLDEPAQHELASVKEITESTTPSYFSNEAIAKQDGISNLFHSTSPTDDNLLRAKSKNNDFQYRIQIAASRTKLSEAQLKKIYHGTNEIHVFKEDGYFKYYINQTPSYPAAKQALEESSVEQAFITVYKDNAKWKLSEAIAAQRNEQNRQAQSPSESENIDLIGSKETIEESVQPDKAKDAPLATASTVTTDSTGTGHLIASDASIAAEEIVASKENISTGLTDENAARTGISDDILAGSPTLLASVNENTSSVKMDQAMNFPLTAAAHGSKVSGERDEFQYRLQIAASKSKLSDARLKKLYNGDKTIRLFKEDGLYKYYILATPNYYVARKTRKESHVDLAFISAYKGEAKFPLQDAIAIQYKVPLIENELTKTDSVVKIVTVNFELDEFVLCPDQVLHLRESVIDELKANEAYHAIVNGYTDIRGTDEYNFGLSQERAFFVEQLIVKEGIASRKVTTQYFGESQVIKYCAEHEHCDESVHQANRRVEILLLMNKK